MELSPSTAVIADLHLETGTADGVAAFVAWLGGLAGLPRLVILGDLFEYWFGPSQTREPGTALVLAALAGRVAAGTPVDVVPGNRDFLLGRGFERLTGCHVHHEGLCGELPGGERVLFLHGDELCTRDRPYQRMRSVLRSAPVRWTAPRVPGLAQLAARRLRRTSRRAVSRKDPATMAMQPAEAARRAAAADAALLVCGHAHAFRDEALPGGARWMVLDAFGGKRDTLVLGADGPTVGPHGALGG